MILVKEAGFDLTDLRGERRVERTVREPSSLATFVGRLTPRTARFVAGGAVGVGLLLALVSGTAAALVAAVTVALACYWLGEFSPEPTATVTEVNEPGLSEHEAFQFLIMHDEHEDMKNDKAEEKARTARRKAGSSGGGTP